MVDQRPQTQLLHWQDLFFCSSRSLTRVRTGMEHCGSRSEREHPNKARVSRCSFLQELIEAPALQQGLPFVSINRVVMCEPASHASHNASHAIHASQGARHASHRFNVKFIENTGLPAIWYFENLDQQCHKTRFPLLSPA